MSKYFPYSKNRTITCSDTGEVVSGDKYLSTKHWKNLRLQVYDYYGGKCQRCGDHISLSVADIHHRVYKRMGEEKVTDLVLYCNHCHKCVHKDKKSKRAENHNLTMELQTLIKSLNEKEKKEAYNLLVKHFDLDYKFDFKEV